MISGALAWIALAWNAATWFVFRHERPPDYVKTLCEFLAWHSPPSDISRVTVRGATYFVLEGNPGRWWPSGPAAYTFDSHGNLVDWSADGWDIESPRMVYDREARSDRISLGEMLELIENAPCRLPNKPAQAARDQRGGDRQDVRLQ